MMSIQAHTENPGGHLRRIGGFFAVSVLCLSSVAWGQDRDRYPDRDRGGDRITRLVPGTVIPIRTNEAIDVNKGDYRVYTGIVDQDVRGDDGRLAIRRGSTVELVVRFAPDNDMILDLDSVTSNGQRYAVKADTKRAQSQGDNSLVGAIFGAVNGGRVQGRAIRVPRDTVITFRLLRPLDVGIPDRGIMRDGRHYHDYDRDSYGQGWYRDQNRGNGSSDPGQYPNR
jgi:hypothetical protein